MWEEDAQNPREGAWGHIPCLCKFYGKVQCSTNYTNSGVFLRKLSLGSILAQICLQFGVVFRGFLKGGIYWEGRTFFVGESSSSTSHGMRCPVAGGCSRGCLLTAWQSQFHKTTQQSLWTAGKYSRGGWKGIIPPYQPLGCAPGLW